MSAVLRNEACRKVFLKARESLDQKMESAVRSMIGYSKHSESDSLGELGFGSCLLLALISALSNSELMLSAALLELSASYSPLESSHFTAWLVEHYTIDIRVIEKALEQLFRIDRSGLFSVPGHIKKLLLHLACQSGIHTDSFPDEDVDPGTEENVEANSITPEGNAQKDHVGNSAANEGACSTALADQFVEKNVSPTLRSTRKKNVTDAAANVGAINNTNAVNSQSAESPIEAYIRMMVINAVITDSSAALEELAAGGADLSMTTDDGQSLLHLAAKEGSIKTARTLIQLGANLNRKDRQGFTPLQKAVQADNMQMIQLLIEAGANASCMLFGGETMLMFTIANSVFSSDSLLLNYGMYINDKNTCGDTVLHTILKEYKNMAQSLTLEQRKLTSSSICNIVKLISDQNGDINITNAAGETALHIAAGIADSEVAQSLLAAGAVTVVQNNVGDTPLHIATSSNNYTILEKLVSSSCSSIAIKNTSGKSPLHLAVSCGFINCIKLLLESSEHIDIEDNSGYTPLCIAAEFGDIAIVEMLCKENIKINHTTKDLRKTPLHLAVENGHTDIVKVLLDKGADVRAKASVCIGGKIRSGLSPLHYAAMGGHVTIVRVLIERGADLGAKDCVGCTPLEWAKCKGHTYIVQYLIESGADLEAKKSSGLTSLKTADVSKHAIASLLKSKR